MLARFGDAPLVLHAAAALTAFAPGWRFAVCRSADDPVALVLAEAGFAVVPNPDAEAGLSTSLNCGVALAAAAGAAAALVCLGDMPCVDAAHLEKLAAAFDPARSPVVASTTDGVAMPPALFARSKFEALMRVRGDRGARDLLAGSLGVPASPELLADIDRTGDLARLRISS